MSRNICHHWHSVSNIHGKPQLFDDQLSSQSFATFIVKLSILSQNVAKLQVACRTQLLTDASSNINNKVKVDRAPTYSNENHIHMSSTEELHECTIAHIDSINICNVSIFWRLFWRCQYRQNLILLKSYEQIKRENTELGLFDLCVWV